jgi:hypothetical protein
VSRRAHAQHAESFRESGTPRELRRGERWYVMGSWPAVVSSTSAAFEAYVGRVSGSAVCWDQSVTTSLLTKEKE